MAQATAVTQYVIVTRKTVLSTVTALFLFRLFIENVKRCKIRLKNWLQSFDSSESSESLQDLSSSASCIALITSAASRPISKRKSADANHLGVDDPKQIRQRAEACKHV